MKKAFEIRFYGKVFGVGFRRYVYRYATETNVFGFVENDYADESVHIVVEGEADNLDAFIALCSNGTPFSNIVDRKITPIEFSGRFNTFVQIR